MERESKFQALSNKNVLIIIDNEALGDNIAWIPSCDAFQKKYQCHLYLYVRKFIRDIVEKQYPNIRFIDKQQIPNINFEAIFDTNKREREHLKGKCIVQLGLIGFAEYYFEVNSNGKAPKLDLTFPRKIKDPYVCIAVQSTDYIKNWNYPNGWNLIVEYLKDILGYKVFCIDKNKVENYNFRFKDTERKSIILKNDSPEGVIDCTGNIPLQERINLLKDADFFVGLSSGLSWLAWACEIPVVMISGFTCPSNEFYTPYRVFPSCGCRDCNSHNICIDIEDLNRCKKAIDFIPECSMNITPQMVIDKINQIPCVRSRIIDYWKNHPTA